MTEFLRSIASSETFMPHGMCYLWEPKLLGLHFFSDLLTGLAYWAIPPLLLYLVVKARREFREEGPLGRKGLPYDWMFVAFGIFIVACGATHFMEVWTIWDPRYWLSGSVKAVTAVASVATAVALPPLIPRALDLVRDARDSELRRKRLEAANRELEELYGQLQEADELKTRLVANVSHELRTPLTLILGPTEELQRRADLDDEVREGLEIIRKNARSLLGQVDELLDVARLELGSVELERSEVDAAGLVTDVVSEFRPLARRRGIALEVDVPDALPCRVDPGKVERVLLNLLSNALKFTPDGGLVCCELEVEPPGAPDGHDVLRLEVRDSGPGIPEDEREKIFDRFQQRDGGSTRRRGGVGLGLSIVRELVELHGGRVEVGDAPEGGARFSALLPIEPAEDRAATAAGPAEEPGTGDARPGGSDAARAEVSRLEGEGAGEPEEAPSPSADPSRDEEGAVEEDGGRPEGGVLVVEDDAELRRFLVRVLEDRHRVESASDGVEALESLDGWTPDLVVTDVMMPRMDGEELLARLRDRDDLADVPVVVLTARAEPELASRLLRAGARDYIMKPVSTEELRARVDTHVQQVRSRRILQRELASQEGDVSRLVEQATERKRILETTVDEKDLLVRELHHRVKGNLQTISSLLNMQIRRTDDATARSSLLESRGRIAAMALLHEKLYQTGDPTRTGMAAYLESLVRDASQSWGTGSVRIELSADDLVFDADRAVTCGLLVHELISNALRHAYRDGDEGLVRVELDTDPSGGTVRLTVRDDGSGLPDEVDPDDPDSLGLTLVRALVDQMDGTLEWERDGGTTWRVTFPRNRRKAA